MTWLEKHKANRKQIASYLAYLPHCKRFSSQIKLCREIARLDDENQRISKMSEYHRQLEIETKAIKVNSLFKKLSKTDKMNYKDHEK